MPRTDKTEERKCLECGHDAKLHGPSGCAKWVQLARTISGYCKCKRTRKELEAVSRSGSR